jgi:hypothetical protein
MVRRRRLKVAYLLGSLLLLAASLHAPTAYSAPGDPPSGSPAGSVYQLPLEAGRSDAAPKGGGGTTAGGGESSGGGGSGGSGSAGGGGGQGGGSGGAAGGASATGESGSLYRSENNFGSSSHVPGVARTGTGGGAGGAASGEGEKAPPSGAVAAQTADTGNASVPAAIALIGGIVVLALGVGLFSRRLATH